MGCAEYHPVEILFIRSINLEDGIGVSCDINEALGNQEGYHIEKSPDAKKQQDAAASKV
jgi:hypothetical protein